MGWTIGVDVGGTFTDFYAANDETGTFHVGENFFYTRQSRRRYFAGLDCLMYSLQHSP